MRKIIRSDVLIIFALALLSLLVHIAPFVLYGAHPLGYDTGFYRRYLTQSFLSFPNAPVPGLGSDALFPRLILDVLHTLQVPTDIALYGSFIILFAAIPIVLYVYLQPSLGKVAALPGMLFAISAVQYIGFWYMLWKNALGLVLIFTAFALIERRLWLWLFLLDLLIPFSHKTTALIYIATLCLCVVLDRTKWRQFLPHIAVTVAAFFLANIGFVHDVVRSTPVAVFLEWDEYFGLAIPLLLALACGFRISLIAKIPRSLIAFAIVSIAIPVLHLPFYQRIFIYTDVALIMLASYAIMYLIQRVELEDWRSYWRFVIICIVIGTFLGNLWHQMQVYQPLLTARDIAAIEHIGSVVPSEATILTTSDEAPWFEGFTSAHVAAPGLLHDTHNFEEWSAFWNSTSTPEKIRFLAELPHPLYVATLGDSSDLLAEPIPCLTPIAENLLRDDCPVNK